MEILQQLSPNTLNQDNTIEKIQWVPRLPSETMISHNQFFGKIRKNEDFNGKNTHPTGLLWVLKQLYSNIWNADNVNK